MNEKEIIQQYLAKALPIIKIHQIATYIAGPILVALLLLVKAERISQMIMGVSLVYLLIVYTMNAHITNTILLCPICGKHLSGSAFRKTVKNVPKECPHCKVVLREQHK